VGLEITKITVLYIIGVDWRTGLLGWLARDDDQKKPLEKQENNVSKP